MRRQKEAAQWQFVWRNGIKTGCALCWGLSLELGLTLVPCKWHQNSVLGAWVPCMASYLCPFVWILSKHRLIILYVVVQKMVQATCFLPHLPSVTWQGPGLFVRRQIKGSASTAEAAFFLCMYQFKHHKEILSIVYRQKKKKKIFIQIVSKSSEG